MKYPNKTKGRLIQELVDARQRIVELEASGSGLKKAEEEKAKLAEAVEITKEAVSLISSHFIIKYSNNAMDELFGYKKGELIGKHISVVNTGPAPKNVARQIGDSIEERGYWEGEIRNKRKDGTEFISYAMISAVRDKDGNILDFISTQHDISERKKAERAMRESEEKYRKVVENVRDIVYSCYADGTIHFVSLNAVSITGYKLGEVIGHNLIEFVHPDDKEHVLSDFEKTIKTGEEFPTIFRLSKKDGSYFDVEEFGKLVREGDKLVGVTGVLRDITQRKQAQEALRQSEELFRLLVENAFDGINICEFDPVTYKRRLFFCNDCYVKMSGYTREELQNSDDLNQLVVQHHSKEELAWHYDCILKGVPFTGYASWKRPDGKDNTYEWSAVSIKNQGKYHIIGIDRDITARKKAEEQLKNSELTLREQKSALEQKNIAFEEIVGHIETEKNKIKDDVAINVNELLLPIIKKLEINGASQRYLDLLEHHLEELTSSFGRKLTEKSLKLSSREIEICNMVKGGLRSKEISSLLNVSYQTIEKHRRNIRKKLGISNKDINLSSFLHRL